MNMNLLPCLGAVCISFLVGCKPESTSSSSGDPKPAVETKPAVPALKANSAEVAVIKTAAGEIVAEFWPEVAPNTVSNFIKLAKSGFYDGTASHRLIKGFMIQMGDPLTKDPNAADRYGGGGPGYTIKAEFNERPHVRGVLSMARSGHPDSAGSQFFICFGTASGLDRQYTTFGKVIKGDDVLAKLETTPVGPNAGGEMSRPLERVPVESIKIVPADSLK